MFEYKRWVQRAKQSGTFLASVGSNQSKLNISALQLQLRLVVSVTNGVLHGPTCSSC